MKYTSTLFNGNPCNECHSSDGILEIEVGTNILSLCRKCRTDLSNLLKEDEDCGSKCNEHPKGFDIKIKLGKESDE